MEPRTVADLITQRLSDWGVERVFGYAGDGIDPLLGALRRAGEPVFVQARHEETAALMASGHAKFTGRVGCVLATQGPGAVHVLNGLYDAKLDHAPVVAIVGQQATTALGSAYQQEIDLQALFKDVAAQYVTTVLSAEQLPMVLDRAVRAAIATRSPTCLIVPHDVQQLPAPDPTQQEHGVMRSSVDLRAARLVPDGPALSAAAEVLNAGERVALLVGQGAAGAADELIEVAELLGAGVTTSLLGKPVLDNDLPFVTGCMGHLGTTASAELMAGCDTLLLVGTNDPWTEYYPAPGQARAVQVDLDGRNLGFRYPTEVNLLGDAGVTLRALLPLLERKTDRAWRGQVEASVARWWRLAEARAGADAVPLNPQRLLSELSPRLPDDAVLCVDVGSVTYWYARHVRLRHGMKASLSSTLASMGSAMPYAVAAKLAFPDRLAVALAGDGAMQMNGINELVTVARMWPTWSDPRLPILVLHNRDLNEVTWEQREMEGEPRFDASQDLPDFPYARYAELLGLGGIRVDAPDQVGPAWDRALAADRPVLIEAIVDPAVPLLPPLVPDETVEQIVAALAEEGSAEAERATALVRREQAES